MSDPSERRSTFENFAFNASREALQGYSEQEIVDILGAEFWRGVFPPNTVGWDIRAWLRGITPDEYPPEKLPAFFWQPKSHQIFISKRESGDGGRASLPGAGDYPEDYPDLVDLRVHHEPDLPHQTPVDRRKAFDDLCFLGEPVAIKLLGQPDAVIYEELSHASAKDYETGGRLYFRTLTLIKSEFDRWCESQEIDSPKLVFQGSRPESEVGSAPSGDLSAAPQASQATPEAQTDQGSEPLSEIERGLKERAQAILEEGQRIYDRNKGLGTRRIALIMVRGADDRKFQGWGYETLRAILDGRHKPCLRLGLKGLGKE